MLRFIDVPVQERVVVLKHGLPIQALGPGRHVLAGFGISVARYRTDDLVFEAPAEYRAVLHADWYAEIVIGTRERGILYRDGKPADFLRPGVHRYWTVDDSVELAVLSVDEPMPELTSELIGVIPPDEYVDVFVHEHERGLHHVQGRFVALLDPGRHTLWSHPGAVSTVRCVDMRRIELALAGQELMTRDKVTLRLSLSVEYGVADPVLMSRKTGNPRDAVYLLTQLVARDYVASVTLDELLEGRDTMRRYLDERCAPKATELGLELFGIGIKDVVLPGDMKLLLNRVIEAEKEAAANVILRREETAATRSLANTAKVMADNPVLLRLKELESLKEMAAQIDEVRLVVGSEGLDRLVQAKLLAGSAER
jgi:regulator of protease activity HflC (stomatin/prohibitin superfamily)